MSRLLIREILSGAITTSASHAPQWQRWTRNGLTALFVIYSISQAKGLLVDQALPDLMMFSGSALSLLGLWLGIGVQQRMYDTIDGLRRTAVLAVSDPQLDGLRASLEAMAARQARWGAAIVGVSEVAVVVSGVLLVPWLVYGAGPFALFDPLLFLALLAIATVTGGFVGWLLGQFAAYGRLPEAVRQSGGHLRMQPGVGDGMGGLRPLVDFQRRQAVLTVLPIVWIGTWLVLTAFSPFNEMYSFWRFPLFLLFGVALFYGAYGFLKPAQSMAGLFHEMAAFASKQNDPHLLAETTEARRRAWPGRGAFYGLVAVFLFCILAVGLRGGPFLFLFGSVTP